MERFLSIPWMEAYAAHCSADEALAAALKGFNASIEYGWLDTDYPNVYLTPHAPARLRLRPGRPGRGHPAHSGLLGRVMVVVYTNRSANVVRIISLRKANSRETRSNENATNE